MRELQLPFAAVTETWLRNGALLDQKLTDIEMATDVKILYKNRNSRAKARGGGVALAFRKSTCNFKERKIKNVKNFEVMCAVGNVRKIVRKVVIFVAYLPPDLTAGAADQLFECVATEIAAVKVSIKDPIIIVCGDFNGKSIQDAFEVDDTIKLIPTGPMRGNRALDLVFSNIGQYVTEAGVLPRLETEEGIPSDHRCVTVKAKIPPTKNFTWIRRTTRKRSDSADRRFAEKLAAAATPEGGDPELLLANFEEWLNNATNECFPLRDVRVRSNEDPWITNGIRRRAKRKRRLYRRKGRTPAWRAADEALQAEIAGKKQEFVDKLLEDPGKSYYRAVKRLGTAGTQKDWGIMDLYQGKEVVDAGKEVLDYFSGVGGDEEPSPTPPIEPVNTAGLGHFDETRVTCLLRSHKKVKSRVDGDPLPHLVSKYPELFAKHVAAIFNAINNTGKWPTAWKREHITVIPKKPRPGSLSDCRNISCTPLLSKVLEGVLLTKLREELTADPNQFGGEKGCGAEHMIVEIWGRVLRVMDDGDHAACLLGLDFEKAFNRMDHGHCLRQLKRLGASKESISLAASFLENRVMSLTIQGVHCGERKIVRGSPQGSVLGCILYCITTQGLAGSARTNHGQRDPVRPPSNDPREHQFHHPPGLPPGPVVLSAVRFFPGSDSSSERDVNFWDSSSSGGPTPHLDKDAEMSSLENESETFKYIDDTTVFEAVPLSSAIRYYTSGVAREAVHPLVLEAAVEGIASLAEEIGMRVNVGKTQLLYISPNNGCETSASLFAGDEVIESAETMKLVGYTFGSAPTAEAHVTAIRADYRQKVWFLFHLREAGIKGMNLYKLYCCYLRSRIEYLSAAYHSMLLKGQTLALERLHRYALRVCFGFEGEIERTMAQLNLETLEARRVRRFDTFLSKAANNPRFRHWFPERPEAGIALRSRRPIEEVRCRTERRFKGPLVYLRRRANDLGVRPRN